MADYTYKEMMKMQNDAVRRVEDMQRRARKAAGLTDEQDIGESTASSVRREPQHIPQPSGYLKTSEKPKETPRTEDKRETDFLDSIRKGFGSIDIDSDKALILSLVLLLSQEKSDEGLLTALIYMLT